MGGRKFRLSTHRKNEERKRRREEEEEKEKEKLVAQPSLIVSIPRHMVKVPPMIVSLPIEAYVGGHVQSSASLSSRLALVSLPSSWIIASREPLMLCKLRVQQEGEASRADLTTTLSVTNGLEWTVSFTGKNLTQTNCSLLAEMPRELTSVTAVSHLISVLDLAKVCAGNPDEKFLKLWNHRALTLHGTQHPSPGVLETSSAGVSTIRNTDCQMLLPRDSAAVRCPPCTTHRSILSVQSHRLEKRTSTPSHDSHINNRYQSLPDLVGKLTDMHHQYRIMSKQCERLKKKIADASEAIGISLDEETHKDMTIVSSQGMRFLEELPSNSFQRIFWDQQLEAAAQRDARTMRWHPLMIRWCLYLRHRSSGAYEALRSSGCLRLPSQRTLRDYTHYIQAKTGFSDEVDKMLMDTAKVGSCPEREKCTLLLLDEMHIREDIVFDKHSGNMIGFANLGEINEHLLQFEKSLQNDAPVQRQPAKTMMVFMVRGLFNSLQFPYAQFPCAEVSGELLYDPFWEAVRRVENCGLKVLGSTVDGNSVNRRLIKIHQPSADVVYKVKNPYAEDDRHFFFSDPPHLVKTIRNCWQSKHRTLWNDGKIISWSHLTQLYNRDTRPGMGLRMVPKIKFEHISLTSFSKMRVDLAAQVLSESVSKAIELTGGEEASETARFVGMVDKFFDAVNVHNYTHGKQSLKMFQMPYISGEDTRLTWLEKDFLGYLTKWEESVRKRPGFSKTEQNRMLLSAETRLGLQITCKSFVELVRYLFTIPGVKSFLSQRICQDPLERFFGCQRQRGGVHDNPNVHEFTKNTQALRVIKSIWKTPSRGNCRGGFRDVGKENFDKPLPKRARRKSPKRPKPNPTPGQ